MPKGKAKDPDKDLRRGPFNPEKVWKREDPPQDQIDNHEKMKGMPKGAWGKYLAYCQSNPGQSFRSHPIMQRQTAINAASDIKKWRHTAGQMKLKFGYEDGWWETWWGHAPDDNDLENWYIWTKWVDPNLFGTEELEEATAVLRMPKRTARKVACEALILARNESLGLTRGRPVGRRASREARPGEQAKKKAGGNGTK